MVQAMTQSFLGYHDKAIPIFEEALKLTPSSATLNSALAESHEHLGDYSSAIFYANQALQLDSGQLHFHRHLIHLNILSDDIESAEILLSQLLQTFPTDTSSLADLVEIQSLLGKSEEALATQEKLIAQEGEQRTNLEVKLHFLKVLEKWEDYEKTLLTLEQIAPQDIAYKQELALFYISQDRPEQAIPKVKDALNLAPSDPTLTSMLARLYEKTGNEAEAEKLYANQQTVEVSDPDVAYQQAFQLVNNPNETTSSSQIAQRILRKALELSPDHIEANSLLGTLLYEDGQYKESGPFLKTAIDLNPRAQDTWLIAIDAFYKSFAFQQTLRLTDDALLLFPGQLPFLERSAQSHIKLGNYDLALRQFNEYLEIVDRSSTLPQTESNRLKGEAYAAAGLVRGLLQETHQSDSLHAIAVSLQPDNPRVLSTVALSLAEQKRKLDTALKHAQKAIALDAENAESMNIIARVHYRMNNMTEAERWLQTVIQSQKPSPYTYEYLGDIRIETGKSTEAIASWTKSLELYPDNPIVLEKLKAHSNKP